VPCERTTGNVRATAAAEGDATFAAVLPGFVVARWDSRTSAPPRRVSRLRRVSVGPVLFDVATLLLQLTADGHEAHDQNGEGDDPPYQHG
jgi:hypothetical protein